MYRLIHFLENLSKGDIIMEIFEMAKLLGLAIREDERIKKLEEAKKAYEEDESIQILTTEYGVQQQALALRTEMRAERGRGRLL